jgi:hypothetical protein
MKLYEKLYRKKIFISLSIIYIPLFKYYVDLNNNGGHTFMTADWLINYNHGFIKRGLMGSVFISISRDKEILLDVISFTLILIYLLIFYLINNTYHSRRQNFISLVLIFSPATFLFPIYDSQGSFRKEILGLLSVLILSGFIKSTKKNMIKFLSAFTYLIAIFSHSVNVFFITTIFAILYKFYKSRKIFDYLLFTVPLFLYLSMYLIFSSSEQQLYLIRDNLCNDLWIIGLDNLCGFGSFDFLVWDINANYLIVQNYIINENRSQYILYFGLFIISFIPYLNDRYAIKNFGYYFLISVSFFPLFIYALDWGRWLYLISLCCLVFYLLSDKSVYSNRLIFLTLVYPFSFRIEHCCNPLDNFEQNFFLNNFIYLLENFKNII